MRALAPVDAAEPDANGWMSIGSAPRETRIFVWGGGPLRFAYLDAIGNWRGLHHRPLVGQPTHWQHLLKSPVSHLPSGAAACAADSPAARSISSPSLPSGTNPHSLPMPQGSESPEVKLQPASGEPIIMTHEDIRV